MIADNQRKGVMYNFCNSPVNPLELDDAGDEYEKRSITDMTLKGIQPLAHLPHRMTSNCVCQMFCYDYGEGRISPKTILCSSPTLRFLLLYSNTSKELYSMNCGAPPTTIETWRRFVLPRFVLMGA